MKTRKQKPKFPPYPSLGYDYGALMCARQDLRPPNKCICLYCRAQAKTEAAIVHDAECPVPPEDRVPEVEHAELPTQLTASDPPNWEDWARLDPPLVGKDGTLLDGHHRRQTEAHLRLLAALRRVEAEKHSPGQRLLDAAYGPQAKACRRDALRLLLGREPKPAEVQWGNWRQAMLEALVVDKVGRCVAERDAAFEEAAALLLSPPAADSLHPEGV